jgi:8-amino-7-oxononanoate synthase
VLGARGLGALEHFGLRSTHVVLMGTLGKSAGVAGAFVAAHDTVVQYLIQRARPYIYTTAAPPALAHALQTSLRIITGPLGHALRDQLHQLLQVWQAGLAQFLTVKADLSSLPCLLPSATPIQPLVLGGNAAVMQASSALMQQGVWVSAIRAPTVPAGTARLRITFSAAHTLTDVHTLLQGLQGLPTLRPGSHLEKAPA